MSWKSRLARLAARFLSPQDLREITNDTSVRMMARMDKEERLAFIQSFVEENRSVELTTEAWAGCWPGWGARSGQS